MAFTIKIYEKNEYISGLLKKRLKSFFPDAYIVNPYFDDQETRFSDYERVLYDPKDISKEELSSFSVSPIRLTEDGGIIDCARFIPMIRKNAESLVSDMKSSSSVPIITGYTDAEKNLYSEQLRQLNDESRIEDLYFAVQTLKSGIPSKPDMSRPLIVL